MVDVRIVAAVLALAASVLQADDPPAPTFANVTVHDPSIVRSADTSYVFGSHLASASSTNLLQWTQLSADPGAGNPIFPNPTSALADAISWVGGSYGFWAPDVIRLGDGRFYFYYCIGRLDQPRAALGLAVSETITGPYAHVAVMLRSGPGGQPAEEGAVYDATRHPNTIDPAVFFDQAGRLWMVYGSYSGGIFILELDQSTGLQKPVQGYGKHLIGGNHARIEGAYILYSPESEYYHLFVSFGGLDSTGGYNIRLGRSRQPDGPYLDAAGTDLANVKGASGTLFDDASIAPHGVKLIGGYQFQHVAGEPGSTTTGYVSPGHNSAIYDPVSDQYFIVFHTRFVGRGEIHRVRVHQMWVNADGWLVVAPHRYAGETIMAAIRSQIPGDYKLINHGKAITSAPSNSTNITLHADGSVTGAVAGTWQLSADYDATLVLDGTVYRGVFVRQWDEDNQRWVMAFSALSGSGVAVWGSKVAIATSPVVVTPPANRTVAAGASATFSVDVTADPVATFQWLRDGVEIVGATSANYAIEKTRPEHAGAYSVRLTNSAGSVTSSSAALTVILLPRIEVHPVSVTQPAGSAVNLTVNASGTATLTYQWFKDGQLLAGATSSTLAFTSLQAADAGDYTVAVTDSVGTTNSRLARITVASPSPGRITNLSVRSVAGVGGQPLIVGFVVNGGSKGILLRAIGPALEAFGVDGVMHDPALALHADVNGSDTIVASNNNWGDGGGAVTLGGVFDQVGAFPLPDAASKDAALVAMVSGSRTAHVSAAQPPTSGVVLVEAYDTAAAAGARLVNVSTRNFAGVDAQSLIAGFVIDGNVPRRVLVRGVGPTLGDFGVSGVLADPRLEIHTTVNNQDRIVASNDDWPDEPGVAVVSDATGAFPLRAVSTDAAIIMTLPPGSYTAVVSGVGGGSGEALIEIYEVD